MQMHPGPMYDQLYELVQAMGYSLVDVNSATVNGTVHVHCIIYSADGVGIDECAKISRAVAPRLELLYDNRDMALEVSSPGVERKFSNMHEFGIFSGKLVRVLTDGNDWKQGVIKGFDGETATIATTEDILHLKAEKIMKAQLVYQEVK